jgi:hypothetical protein
MPENPAVPREIARESRPGGAFVHIGVPPACYGGFADRSEAGPAFTTFDEGGVPAPTTLSLRAIKPSGACP